MEMMILKSLANFSKYTNGDIAPLNLYPQFSPFPATFRIVLLTPASPNSSRVKNPPPPPPPPEVRFQPRLKDLRDSGKKVILKAVLFYML